MNLSSEIPKYLIHESFTIEDIVINRMMIDEGIEPSFENFQNYKLKYKEIREEGLKALDKIITSSTNPTEESDY